MIALFTSVVCDRDCLKNSVDGPTALVAYLSGKTLRLLGNPYTHGITWQDTSWRYIWYDGAAQATVCHLPSVEILNVWFDPEDKDRWLVSPGFVVNPKVVDYANPAIPVGCRRRGR